MIQQGADKHMGAGAGGRSVAIGVVGNFVEFYDWTIYAYMAPVFASQFFPSHDPATSTILAFSVFGSGYFARLLGALIIGVYGDRLGRRPAMMMCIIGMTLGTFVIAICPPYAAIGIAAPIILTLSRLCQGMSAGGESGIAQTYLIEFGEEGRRARAGSWQQISMAASILCALAMSSFMTMVMDTATLANWGWRIPFFAGAIMGLIGVLFRTTAEETPMFLEARKSHELQKTGLMSLASIWRRVALTTVALLFPATAILIWWIYLPTYIEKTTIVSRGAALNINILGVVCFLAMVRPSAALADRIGRRPMLAAHILGGLLWAYPTFVGLPTFANSIGGAIVVTVVGNLLLALSGGCLAAFASEQFETPVRAAANSVSYTVAVVLVGSTFPLVITLLMQQRYYVFAFSYVAVTAAVSLLALLALPETRSKILGGSSLAPPFTSG
jgi:MHS family alpha-ketoglutarate permease-like MFS transporter